MRYIMEELRRCRDEQARLSECKWRLQLQSGFGLTEGQEADFRALVPIFPEGAWRGRALAEIAAAVTVTRRRALIREALREVAQEQDRSAAGEVLWRMLPLIREDLNRGER